MHGLLFYVRIRILKWGSAAVYSYFIFYVQENCIGKLPKNLKTQHDFTDRGAMHGISMFNIELSVFDTQTV